MNKTERGFTAIGFKDTPAASEFDAAQRAFMAAERRAEESQRYLAQCADRLAKARYEAGKSKIKGAGDGK